MYTLSALFPVSIDLLDRYCDLDQELMSWAARVAPRPARHPLHVELPAPRQNIHLPVLTLAAVEGSECLEAAAPFRRRSAMVSVRPLHS